MRWNDWSPPKWSSFPSLYKILFQSFRMRYVCVLAFHCTNLTCGFALFSSGMSSQQTLSKQVAQNPLLDQKGYMLDEIWQGQCAAAVLTSSKKTCTPEGTTQFSVESSGGFTTLRQGKTCYVPGLYCIRCLYEFSLLGLMNFSYDGWSCSGGHGVGCSFII